MHLLAALVATFTLYGPSTAPANSLQHYSGRIVVQDADPGEQLHITLRIGNWADIWDVPVTPGEEIDVADDVMMPASGFVVATLTVRDTDGTTGRASLTTRVLAQQRPAAGVNMSASSYQDNRAPSCPIDPRPYGGICPVPLGSDDE